MFKRLANNSIRFLAFLTLFIVALFLVKDFMFFSKKQRNDNEFNFIVFGNKFIPTETIKLKASNNNSYDNTYDLLINDLKIVSGSENQKIVIVEEKNPIFFDHKKIYITHGDGILTWDKGYRVLKFILRSKLFRIAYSFLPKSIALKIAKRISYERKDSHKIDNHKLEKIHLELINYARSKWSKGCDIVLMGHYHHSFNFNENDNQLIILDDCSDQKFNYAKYDGLSISIESL